MLTRSENDPFINIMPIQIMIKDPRYNDNKIEYSDNDDDDDDDKKMNKSPWSQYS